mmetsp:Transcript_27305/g.68966  ORF Transcript_27305/g.68966 Transcript_27305/m.68966 type:complete len:147 (-) Transcript_27305:1182-1622(-)
MLQTLLPESAPPPAPSCPSAGQRPEQKAHLSFSPSPSEQRVPATAAKCAAGAQATLLLPERAERRPERRAGVALSGIAATRVGLRALRTSGKESAAPSISDHVTLLRRAERAAAPAGPEAGVEVSRRSGAGNGEASGMSADSGLAS